MSPKTRAPAWPKHGRCVDDVLENLSRPEEEEGEEHPQPRDSLQTRMERDGDKNVRCIATKM